MGNTQPTKIRDELQNDLVFKDYIQNTPGKVGPKGDPFTYNDFTEEQLQILRGPKGDPFTYDDFTQLQLQGLIGPRGEPGIPGNIGDPNTTSGLNINMTMNTPSSGSPLSSNTPWQMFADNTGQLCFKHYLDSTTVGETSGGRGYCLSYSANDPSDTGTYSFAKT
jgi:hypothetical protein